MSRISNELRTKIIRDARNRCGYCQSRQLLIPIPFEIEHIIPEAKGGLTQENNLWLACRVCNSFKHARTHAIDPMTEVETKIFNPREQEWHEHFEFDRHGTQILGLTACGRATVIALRLNSELWNAARRLWVDVGWFPPAD